MKSLSVLTLGCLSMAALSGVTQARSISTAEWSSAGGEQFGASAAPSAGELRTLDLAAPLGPLLITPGDQSGKIFVGGMQASAINEQIEFSWGGNAISGNPNCTYCSTAQVIFAPNPPEVAGHIDSFNLEFGYVPGTTPYDASVTYDGVVYSSVLTGNSSPAASELTFNLSKNDTWSVVAPSNWSTVSAPEIDPTSAISALTLLAGALTLLGGTRSRGNGVSVRL